jgi:Flp pilus assembly protein TadD
MARRCAPLASAAQAAAMLEQATIAHPGDKALLAALAGSLVDNGNFQQAFDVLGRAHSPENPDWRILSVQGTVLDQLGRHDEARRYYASALKIVPGRAVGAVQSRPVLCAVEGFAEGGGDASPGLCQRRADARVRQNLGLVVGLQGRFSPKPKPSSAPICRPTRRRPTSPI